MYRPGNNYKREDMYHIVQKVKTCLLQNHPYDNYSIHYYLFSNWESRAVGRRTVLLRKIIKRNTSEYKMGGAFHWAVSLFPCKNEHSSRRKKRFGDQVERISQWSGCNLVRCVLRFTCHEQQQLKMFSPNLFFLQSKYSFLPRGKPVGLKTARTYTYSTPTLIVYFFSCRPDCSQYNKYRHISEKHRRTTYC